MNANGNTFYLLLGEDDWGSCTSPDGLVLGSAWETLGEEKNGTGLEWDR